MKCTLLDIIHADGLVCLSAEGGNEYAHKLHPSGHTAATISHCVVRCTAAFGPGMHTLPLLPLLSLSWAGANVSTVVVAAAVLEFTTKRAPSVGASVGVSCPSGLLSAPRSANQWGCWWQRQWALPPASRSAGRWDCRRECQRALQSASRTAGRWDCQSQWERQCH